MIVLYWLIGKEMVLLIVGFLLLFAFWSEPLDAHMRWKKKQTSELATDALKIVCFDEDLNGATKQECLIYFGN